jgi:hypothetical protein
MERWLQVLAVIAGFTCLGACYVGLSILAELREITDVLKDILCQLSDVRSASKGSSDTLRMIRDDIERIRR